MPPKKAKKSKAEAQEETGGELSLQDKISKLQVEIDALTRELGLKSEMVIRLRNTVQNQKAKISSLEEQIEIRIQDRKDLTADMGRQYKTMQAELASKVEVLARENQALKHRIKQIETTLTTDAKRHEEELTTKEGIIEEQALKMQYMTSEFEGMLTETLSKMTKKLETVTQKWKETDKSVISDANMRRLEDFNLTRIALGEMTG